MMQLLESFLERGWRITFTSPAAVGEHKADLASLGITEVNATTTGEPAYYAPLRPIPAQAMATHSAWTAPAPLALASLHPWASTERPHDNTRTWTGRWDSTPWRRSFETRTTTTEEPEEP